MSYSIIYDKQFIKLPNGKFVPMILAGDNNVYEVTSGRKGRRARDWNNYSYALKGKKYGSLEEMLANSEEQRKSSYEREVSYRKANDEEPITEKDYNDRFGWFTALAMGSKHTSATTYSMYVSLFKTGVKKALTIEQLKEVGISCNVHTSYFGLDEMRAEGVEPFTLYAQTSQELLDIIDAKEAELSGKKTNFYISISANERSMKMLRTKYFPTTKKTAKVIDPNDYYVLQNESGYFVKNTKFGYQYQYYEGGRVKRFESDKAAQSMLKRIKGSYHGFQIKHVMKELVK